TSHEKSVTAIDGGLFEAEIISGSGSGSGSGGGSSGGSSSSSASSSGNRGGEPDAASTRFVERFVGACWDVGLSIGHAVRTSAQCRADAGQDLSVMTSLMERRPITGSSLAIAALDEALADVVSPSDFLRDKLLEMQQRHQKFEDTPYSLEPNCKESPGALRDLQTIAWVARAAQLGDSWSALVDIRVIEPREAVELKRHEIFLKRVRAWLHIVANRREDRLVFDLQTAVAREMGFRANDARGLSEALMHRYYLAAKMITQLSTILLQQIELRVLGGPAGEVAVIDADFARIGDLLDIRRPDAFERDPQLILRAFLQIAGHSGLSGMTARTLRALWHARFRIDARFRTDPTNRANFLALLQAPHGVTHELRRMNKWSVLGRYLPPFRRIVGRMQHDLFHVYTVDQHILMVVRNLRRFMLAEYAHEYPFCSQLIAEFERPWLLVVAALFHDIAKGRGGDHSVLGAADVQRFCRQHGIDGEDRELAAFLVRHHLTMSLTAQKQDITDPEVLRRFSAIVGTDRRLVALYLLTVADIRGTSAKVWNAWKGKLLEDLFRATRAHLAGDRPATHERLDARRGEAARLLLMAGLDRSDYQRFWADLDIGYFLRNEPADIAWHTRVLHRGRGEAPMVRTRISPLGEGFEVVVHAADRPGLFARICRYFDRKNLSILDARVHTTASGHALDSFVVVDPLQDTHYRDVLRLVESELAELLSRDQDLTDLRPAPSARLSRRSRAFPLPPKVDLRPDERGRRFLLSVTATDRTGLLYDVARVLAQNGFDLSGARIMTLGERAEDTFIIEGRRLAQERVRVQLERELLSTL
ncbi:MAG: [protein-PII] uridylyltransferase, partial [Burkholderiaceae bacterium]